MGPILYHCFLLRSNLHPDLCLHNFYIAFIYFHMCIIKQYILKLVFVCVCMCDVFELSSTVLGIYFNKHIPKLLSPFRLL